MPKAKQSKEWLYFTGRARSSTATCDKSLKILACKWGKNIKVDEASDEARETGKSSGMHHVRQFM